MRYKKPAVFGFENPLRPAQGLAAPGCIEGSSAGGGEMCSSGASGTVAQLYDCVGGGDPNWSGMECVSGSGGMNPGCVAGGDASYECSTGSTPFFSSYCTAGPSGPLAT